MPDWTEYVRRNLRLSHLRPERETEIVEDLAGQLDQAYAEALLRGLTSEQAEAAASSTSPIGRVLQTSCCARSAGGNLP